MRAALATLLTPAALPAPALASDGPPGATWTQAYIPSTDGVKLHADILRPKGYTNADRTPVIVSIGPYFNHSGQTGVSGPVEETPFDPLASPGPSTRFYDFETGGDLFK